MDLHVKGLEPGCKQATASWYAVYTKHQHEKKSAALLARKGIEVFLPTYRSMHQWKDRKKVLVLPLFPSYVLVKTDLVDKLQILETPGVFYLVESIGRACPIPEEDIEWIRAVTQSNREIEPHLFLQHGDRVCIRSGALAGVQGMLVRVKNQHRVVINIELLRKAVSLEIDIENVERVCEVGSRGVFLPANVG